jgi:hypothetical protein
MPERITNERLASFIAQLDMPIDQRSLAAFECDLASVPPADAWTMHIDHAFPLPADAADYIAAAIRARIVAKPGDIFFYAVADNVITDIFAFGPELFDRINTVINQAYLDGKSVGTTVAEIDRMLDSENDS